MTGTIVDAAAIVISGTVASRNRQLAATTQNKLKFVLGFSTVAVGLRLVWLGLPGPFLLSVKQLAICVLALMLGKVTGRLLKLQRVSNHLGRAARGIIEQAAHGQTANPSAGFHVGAMLFCAAPLAWLGAFEEGLSGRFAPLLIKAVIDALTTMAFIPTLGRGVILSAIVVLAWQGSITIAIRALAPFLNAHGLAAGLNAVAGFLIFCVSLIVLEIRKMELADYAPSLVWMPLLTWLLR